MWRWLCSLTFSLWVWGLIIMRIIFSLDNSASHYPSMFLYACSEGFFKLMNEERLHLWSMCVYLGVRVLRVQDGRSCVPLWHPPKSLIYCLSVLCSGLQDTHTHTQLPTHLPIRYIFPHRALHLLHNLDLPNEKTQGEVRGHHYSIRRTHRANTIMHAW